MTVEEGCDFFENISNIKVDANTKKGWTWIRQNKATSYNTIWWRSAKNKTGQRTIKKINWKNYVFLMSQQLVYINAVKNC